MLNQSRIEEGAFGACLDKSSADGKSRCLLVDPELLHELLAEQDDPDLLATGRLSPPP
jgi:hypothetical protein